MEQVVTFLSDGLTLRGVLHIPDGAKEPRPALILCHGFGGSCRGAGHPELARALEATGYVALRFDFRGCGQSDGAKGSVICLEEVEDLRRAIDFLDTQSSVARNRIGVIVARIGRGGFEAYAADDHCLGLFRTPREAAAAITMTRPGVAERSI